VTCILTLWIFSLNAESDVVRLFKGASVRALVFGELFPKTLLHVTNSLQGRDGHLDSRLQ
jgi:hypothetical protein